MIRIKGETEQKAVEKFEEQIKDLELEDKEVTMLRFLRARDLNLNLAENLLREDIKWREENDIKLIRKMEFSSVVTDDMRYYHVGGDSSDRPVHWVPMGSWNIKKLIESGYKEEVTKYIYHIFEKYAETIENCEADQGVLVLDLKDLSYSKISSPEMIQLTYNGFKALALHYPERCWRIYTINSPSFLPMILSILKPILSERTRDKIHAFGYDKKPFLKKLLEHFDEHSIPEQLISY